MMKVGIIGWRGMVGSTLVNRMITEGDFNNFDPFFFSTSKIGKIKSVTSKIHDAYDLKKLSNMKIIVSCQGSNYTKKIHASLRSLNWKGYWLDTSSELRMNSKSIIVLDPINKSNIKKALSNGILDYIGGNCTVSLMLMAIHGLFLNDWIEWVVSMTYQAISGAGVKKTKDMLLQMQNAGKVVSNISNIQKISNFGQELSTITEKDLFISKKQHSNNFMPINLIPWIGNISNDNSKTKEEWKGFEETNKILGLKKEKRIIVDGQCVRVGTLRCHSQALTIKLKKNITIKKIENVIKASNKWVKLITNNEKETVKYLTPASVSGTLNIRIGRLRKLNIGEKYLTAFTIGDQLIWGAAEPIRRTLSLIIKYISK